MENKKLELQKLKSKLENQKIAEDKIIKVKNELQEEYDKIKKEISEMETKSIYNLKEGDEYGYIEHGYIALYSFWYNTNVDIERLQNGNVFLTEEEAEQKIDFNQSEATIDKWIFENGADGDDLLKYYCCIIYDKNEDEFYRIMEYKHYYQGSIRIKSRELAEKLIDDTPKQTLITYLTKGKGI